MLEVFWEILGEWRPPKTAVPAFLGILGILGKQAFSQKDAEMPFLEILRG